MNQSLAIRFVMILSLLISSFQSQAEEVFKIDISELRPTQLNVGMIEVKRKTEKLMDMKSRERKEYLKENFVPVVVGPAPEKNLYVIDHHHLSRAVLAAGHDKVYAKIISDMSSLSLPDFWIKMEQQGFVYLKNEHGQSIHHSQLPQKISELGDDPYRSLAGAVRRKDGYSKDPTPFAEFKWADFFRSKIPINNEKASFKEAIEKALVLVKSPDAQELPGYREQCKAVFL